MCRPDTQRPLRSRLERNTVSKIPHTITFITRCGITTTTVDLPEGEEITIRVKRANPKVPKEANSKLPWSSNTDGALFYCDVCNGPVLPHNGPGRYLGGSVRVPDDFTTATCEDCGQVYTTAQEEELLAAILDKKEEKQ